jgi:hypothetical protein
LLDWGVYSQKRLGDSDLINVRSPTFGLKSDISRGPRRANSRPSLV